MVNSLCEFVSASNNQQMNTAAGYIGEVRLIFALAQKLASLSLWSAIHHVGEHHYSAAV
jgi:hypothetical protein